MNLTHASVSVILLAGGNGLRFGSPVPKQFLPLKKKLIIHYSFEEFLQCPYIFEIIIVCAPAYQQLFPQSDFPKIRFALPGERRQDSVFNGLRATTANSSLICIHDAARPFISQNDLRNVIETAAKTQAATLATAVTNTIKQTDGNAQVLRTLERSKLFEVQTPQVISPALLNKGFAHAREKNITVTDDTSLVELLHHPVKLVLGSPFNIKITTSDGIRRA